MFKFRLASAFAGLLVIGACGSPSTAKPVATSSSNPTSAASATPAGSFGNAVLVGHSDSTATVVVMRLDGSIMATLPGVGVVDQHAVGAYLVVASFGSSKGWTIDASGVVKDVAPAAVAILSPPTNSGPATPR